LSVVSLALGYPKEKKIVDKDKINRLDSDNDSNQYSHSNQFFSVVSLALGYPKEKKTKF